MVHLFAFFLGLLLHRLDTPGGPIPHKVGALPSVFVPYALSHPVLPGSVLSVIQGKTCRAV
jgi:hypothetical protein